jgi:hypothetical protein
VIPVRFHHLLAAARSGAHAQWSLEGGEQDETYAMEGGAALHGLLLKGDRVLCFDTARRGRAWEQFAIDNPGAHILSPAVYDRVQRMAESVHRHPEACELLEGIREQTLLFRFLGLECRSTPDVRTPRRLVELKTTRDASPWGFARDIERRHYHAQMAFQRAAVMASGLGQPDDAYIVAVESTEPHVVTLFRLTPATLDMGDRLVRLWMERLAGCVRSGAWPGYSQAVVDVDLGQREDVELDFTGVPEAP